MSLKNVLVVAYYFPPMGLSGVQRTLKFCKYLPDYGWKPIVLTTTPSAYYAFDQTLLDELDPEKISIYRTKPDLTRHAKPKKGNVVAYPSRLNQKFRRMISQTIFQPDSRITWRKAAIKLGEQIFDENKIDSVFATAPPFTDFLVASELATRFGKQFVLDYRDLWVDNAYYFYATPFHKIYSRNLESKILIRAKRAIVTTRGMKEMLLKRYTFLSHEDITIIPHGYDSSDFNGMEHIKPNPAKFTITHSGLFPDDLTPKYFLKALANFLAKNKEAKQCLEARFIGIMRKSHLKMIYKLKLHENVVCTGYIPHTEAVGNLLQSDALWMMITNNIATPSRLYEYIGSRKPMLVSAPEGSIRKAAEDSAAALTTDPKDIKAIEKAISNLFEMWKSGKLPKISRSYADLFDRKVLTSDLAREISLAGDF